MPSTSIHDEIILLAKDSKYKANLLDYLAGDLKCKPLQQFSTKQVPETLVLQLKRKSEVAVNFHNQERFSFLLQNSLAKRNSNNEVPHDISLGLHTFFSLLSYLHTDNDEYHQLIFFLSEITPVLRSLGPLSLEALPIFSNSQIIHKLRSFLQSAATIPLTCSIKSQSHEQNQDQIRYKNKNKNHGKTKAEFQEQNKAAVVALAALASARGQASDILVLVTVLLGFDHKLDFDTKSNSNKLKITTSNSNSNSNTNTSNQNGEQKNVPVSVEEMDASTRRKFGEKLLEKERRRLKQQTMRKSYKNPPFDNPTAPTEDAGDDPQSEEWLPQRSVKVNKQSKVLPKKVIRKNASSSNIILNLKNSQNINNNDPETTPALFVALDNDNLKGNPVNLLTVDIRPFLYEISCAKEQNSTFVCSHDRKNRTIREVWTCGQNSYGELGHGDALSRHSHSEVLHLRDIDVIQVAAGNEHTVVLTSDGQIYSAGYNDNGQCGQGHQHRVPKLSLIEHLPGKTKVAQIHAYNGCEHTMVVMEDGRLFSFGYNYRGQLGHGTTVSELVPRPVRGLDSKKVRQFCRNNKSAIFL